MLSPEQIEALRISAGAMADPINRFLIEDIARRIAGAGQLTSTAAYQVYRAQHLGLSRKQIERKLGDLLGKSKAEVKELLTQAAEVGYDFDLKNIPTAAIPFEQNASVQQMVAAAALLAQADFSNLTQTLGMVDPVGKVQPLREAYRKSMDYAFAQVFTGAADYNTATRQASKNIAAHGVRVIDYESGVHTSLEAAVRRNIMGGLGLMQEQISEHNYDQFGANGWEISAHANSAPDHEPMQGKQYTDAQYKALNSGLHRRIGTLNCGHAAFPIVLGVSEVQHAEAELKKFREENAKGVHYENRHYTGYEATQKQRQIERAIRTQERRIVVDEAVAADSLLQNQMKLRRLNAVYRHFSKAAGLRTERERLMVVGFGKGQARRANAAAGK